MAIVYEVWKVFIRIIAFCVYAVIILKSHYDARKTRWCGGMV